MFCKNPSKPNKEIPPKKTAKAILPEKIPKLYGPKNLAKYIFVKKENIAEDVILNNIIKYFLSMFLKFN